MKTDDAEAVRLIVAAAGPPPPELVTQLRDLIAPALRARDEFDRKAGPDWPVVNPIPRPRRPAEAS